MSYIAVKLIKIALICLLLTQVLNSASTALTNSASQDPEQSLSSLSSWWAVFKIENQNGFNGSITHIHLADPGDWDDISADALAVSSLLGIVPGGQIVAGTAVAWQFIATNTDGTYDFYIIQGTKYTLFAQKYILVPLDFIGFVPDASWRYAFNMKKPVSKRLANMEKDFVMVSKVFQDSNQLIPVIGQRIKDKAIEDAIEPFQIMIETQAIKEVANDYRTYIPDPDFSTSWYGTI